MSAKDNLSVDEIADYKKAFAVYDDNGDGTITVEELQSVMKSMGHDVPRSQVEEMLLENDENNDGVVDFDEFLTAMTRIKLDPQQELMEAFKVFDRDGNGYITVDELRATIRQCGENATDAQVEQMVHEADLVSSYV